MGHLLVLVNPFLLSVLFLLLLPPAQEIHPGLESQEDLWDPLLPCLHGYQVNRTYQADLGSQEDPEDQEDPSDLATRCFPRVCHSCCRGNLVVLEVQVDLQVLLVPLDLGALPAQSALNRLAFQDHPENPFPLLLLEDPAQHSHPFVLWVQAGLVHQGVLGVQADPALQGVRRPMDCSGLMPLMYQEDQEGLGGLGDHEDPAVFPGLGILSPPSPKM